ncbi:MAG: class I SAM-dependent methyltransferase [bacterium]|nr:class I SAM-dependent methyltransferase [bacterium]
MINKSHWRKLNISPTRKYWEDYSLDPGRRAVLEEYFSRKGRLLYIGSEPGRDCVELAKNGYEVIGIDFVEKYSRCLSKYSRRNGFNDKDICMDAGQLGFKKESFDYVVVEFYSFLPNRNTQRSFINSIVDILKPNGMALVTAERSYNYCYW